MSEQSATKKQYKASCHCGAFAYTVTTTPLDDPNSGLARCNCSICTRNGYLLVYVPNEQVVFEKGSIEDFKAYTFASHKVAHYFCPTCGSSCMARSVSPGFFDGMSIVNIRLFEGVEVEGLKVKEMDGRNYNPEKA